MYFILFCFLCYYLARKYTVNIQNHMISRLTSERPSCTLTNGSARSALVVVDHTEDKHVECASCRKIAGHQALQNAHS